jgi:hypothetical protein
LRNGFGVIIVVVVVVVAIVVVRGHSGESLDGCAQILISLLVLAAWTHPPSFHHLQVRPGIFEPHPSPLP